MQAVDLNDFSSVYFQCFQMTEESKGMPCDGIYLLRLPLQIRDILLKCLKSLIRLLMNGEDACSEAHKPSAGVKEESRNQRKESRENDKE